MDGNWEIWVELGWGLLGSTSKSLIGWKDLDGTTPRCQIGFNHALWQFD